MEKIRIKSLLKASFNGSTWHGPSLLDQLKGLDTEVAARKANPNAHSIWELVLHIIAWREFAIQKLSGNEAYDLPIGGEKDWPIVDHMFPESWGNTLTSLANTQQRLLDQIEYIKDDKLMEMVPGKNYDFYTLIHGIIQHDIYHGGQIALLKK